MSLTDSTCSDDCKPSFGPSSLLRRTMLFLIPEYHGVTTNFSSTSDWMISTNYCLTNIYLRKRYRWRAILVAWRPAWCCKGWDMRGDARPEERTHRYVSDANTSWSRSWPIRTTQNKPLLAGLSTLRKRYRLWIVPGSYSVDNVKDLVRSLMVSLWAFLSLLAFFMVAWWSILWRLL